MEQTIEQLIDEIKAYSNTNLKEQAQSYDESGEYPEAIMNYLFDRKLLHLIINHNELNGQYSDFLEIIRLLSKTFAAVGSILFTQATCGVYPISKFGTTIQKINYLERLMSGEMIASFALNEVESGSNIQHIHTIAEKTDDGWRLDGEKVTISNAPIANLFYVVAKVYDADGNNQYGIFLIERGTPGLTIGSPDEKIGVKALPVSSVSLENVEVNHDALLGNTLDGLKQVEQILNKLRLAIAAQSIGIAQGALEMGYKHVTYERRFGQRLIDLQDTQVKMAEAQTKIAAAEASLFYVLKHDPNDTIQVSMLKLIASGTATQVTETVMQVTGGYAFMKHNEIERYVRDARITAIYGGSSNTHKRIISIPWLKK
ncbi:acyl-CoA dehydrogenase family protein [Tuanshanicoccus lijuaniae]|uniref:acyl-CoA dehydrogenase family protein n=1 Tax=Aerococcaceae bacterium zg-1292 TaxID=2774330 RepID=UPI001938436D|nr:acyl-CoA dehydrogenase family protein [Aerococcaceae bacterium zg-1292]MBF6625801.1 acyl-CoA dehydrogenase family protein [Aerococcaceae bacterium zg-BR9]MBF6978638.1 acyl-CoA dehydrogenase family protein [Aerococcaceae bacterium zg-BR22]MBS4455623.1 acyl-CoA dehydrogenase family protein [Aerococcaceae bacterium zg-A91]MBS4457242.1 acyl-CoA dehydrogenase family protein [Aerococcaceae bacterium zg-BR33]